LLQPDALSNATMARNLLGRADFDSTGASLCAQ